MRGTKGESVQNGPASTKPNIRPRRTAMNISLTDFISLIGTLAFATSGAFVGIHKGMDIFGINVLAITTACGGGLLRDLIVGDTPPAMFQNPLYVGVAALVANAIFLLLSFHQSMPKKLVPWYETLLFWFDTLGLGAFTLTGVLVGKRAGYGDNLFLLVFLGFLTGVGGGALRDILANQMPDIFVKHIYALASIAGGLVMSLLLARGVPEKISLLTGFATVVLLRCLASHYRWNLPNIT